VVVFHSPGARGIPMEKLPPEVQKQLGYRPKKTPKRPAPEPAPAKAPEPKAAAQKPPDQKPPLPEAPEPKTNIAKLAVEKPEPPEPAAPKAVMQTAPPPKTSVQEPVVQKAPEEKPPARKAARRKPLVRKVQETASKAEAEQWLKESEKKVWNEVWSNYDDAAQEAGERYDATNDPERWRDYQEELWKQYNADLCKELAITPVMLRRLIEKGYREDWPVEKSPEDKVKIANEAGEKPVSDEPDGSVAAVASYLHDKLGESSAVEYLRWYPPLLDETTDGYVWAVEVKYRSVDDDGNPVTETGTAHIRHNKVVDFTVRSRK
jgi:hypothetical protein